MTAVAATYIAALEIGVARGAWGQGPQVSIAGSSDAVVNASESLDATIAGSGDIVYRGSPAVTQHIRGSGSLRKLR